MRSLIRVNSKLSDTGKDCGGNYCELCARQSHSNTIPKSFASGKMSLKSSLLSSLLLALSAALLIPSTMAQTFSLAQTFTGNASKIATDDNYVIVGHMEVLSVWNSTLDGGTKIRDIVTGYTEPIVAMDAWDGIVYAVTSNAPRSIRAWNYITGVERWRAPAVGNSHDDVVTDLVVGTNSLCLYTSSMDGTIKIWRTSDAQLHTVQNPIGPSGFFAPVHKLFLDRTRNPTRIYAIYGRHVAADGVGRATETLPDHDFEGILTSTNMPSSRYLGMTWACLCFWCSFR